MTISTSYNALVLDNNVFTDTIKKYREVLAYLIAIVNKEWEIISLETYAHKRQSLVEHMIHSTKHNNAVYNDFDIQFPNFPSYLRRAAITNAVGIVSSYRSNLKRWEENGKIGKTPSLQYNHYVMPVFYRDHMYRETDEQDVVELKLFVKNSWQHIKIKLRHTDMQYIRKYWSGVRSSAPILEKRYGKYYLRFTFEENVKLNDVDIYDQVICSVDMGINNDAVCSIMKSDGTILLRKFINFPSDKDHIIHVFNRIKKKQRNHGVSSTKKMWSYLQHINAEHGNKVSAAIVEFAVQNNANCIVFEHIDLKGVKTGRNNQLLTMWRRGAIQSVTALKAHRKGIRISHTCASKTSNLAYDGSGEVIRNKNNYSLCTFLNNKQYNCDLNASYNIGARYFIREILKTLPVKERSRIEAKVPDIERRTLNTLHTLKQLNAELNN